MAQQATQREGQRWRECFIDLVLGTCHCHFSLSICFSTDWKTTNEQVYIFSGCFTQVWNQPGRGVCSLSKALAVSPSVSLSLSQLPGPLHPAKSLLIVSPPHSLGFSLFSTGQQPHHMFCIAHTHPSLLLLLSFVLFWRRRCRGSLGFIPFHSPSELGAGADFICSYFCAEVKSPCRKMFFYPLMVLGDSFVLPGLLWISGLCC